MDNIFITVGGAEKNGWLTHYHSHYYGFVIAAFLIGIAAFNEEMYNRNFGVAYKLLLPIVAVILLIFSVSVGHYYKGQGIYYSLKDYYGRPKNLSSTLAQINIFNKLANHVPAGATVTSTEWGMAAWYLRGNKVNIFPIGIGVNDYIMVQNVAKYPDIKLLSAVRYKNDKALADGCFEPVFRKKYTEIAREGTWALFKKNTQKSNK